VQGPSRTVASVPLPVLISLVLAVGLNYVTMVAKAYAEPGGPLAWTILFRPSQVIDLRFKAIGVDMLVTALGAQLGFMATDAIDSTPSSAPNLMLETLPPHWSVPQDDLNVWVLGVVVGFLILVPTGTRFWGFPSSGPREDVVVRVPNLLGTMAIMMVYLLSPLKVY
jgi:hypothetical protein